MLEDPITAITTIQLLIGCSFAAEHAKVIAIAHVHNSGVTFHIF